MRKSWLACVAGLALAAGPAVGDVLDDLGIDAVTCADTLKFSSFGPSGTNGSAYLGLPISDDHAAEVVAELARFSPRLVLDFHEQRGDFEKALALATAGSPERIRLLLRLGRRDEAREAAAGRAFQDLEAGWGFAMESNRIFRPLEDAGDWDTLEDYLKILADAAIDPVWKGRVWAEELDVAWHRDRLPELLAGAAGDPLRLAVFHRRLGSRDESAQLAEGILKDATPAAVAEIVSLLPDLPSAAEAGLALWRSADLDPAARPPLLRAMFRLPDGAVALEALRVMLAQGGDPLPLLNVLWDQWARSEQTTPQRSAAVAELFKRAPDEPRVRFLWAREIIRSDPRASAELFESLARLPLDAAGLRRGGVTLPKAGSFSATDPAQLAYYGFAGLGILNRQDRVEAVIRNRPDWRLLPIADRFRYLAAGGMDREMLAEWSAADFTKPENDRLGASFRDWLDARLQSRLLPPETARTIAAKWPEMALGSVGKKPELIATDAVNMLDFLAKHDVPADLWRTGNARLRAAFAARHPEGFPALDSRLHAVGKRISRLAGIFPPPAAPFPEAARADFEASLRTQPLLRLFMPPQIRRIAANREGGWGMRRPDYDYRYPAALPLALLFRWSDSLESWLGPFRRTNTGEEKDRKALLAMLGHFPAGHPRRIPAELLIAGGQLDCGDAEIEKAAEATAAALLTGEREARGTEAFRFSICQRIRNPAVAEADCRKILEEMKFQPPSVRQDFLFAIQFAAPGREGFLKIAREALSHDLPKSSRPAPPVRIADSALTPGGRPDLAAADRNLEALSAIIAAGGSDAILILAKREILAAFGESRAADVLGLLRGVPMSDEAKWAQALPDLHQYFLAADPTLAADFRLWLAAYPVSLASARLKIATQLAEAGSEPEAAEFLAAALRIPADYPGFSHQFPPLEGRISSPAKLGPEIDFLKRHRLLETVLARLEPPAAVDPIVLATFRLAAGTDLAAFERDILPGIASESDFARETAFHSWRKFAAGWQLAPDLELRLLEEGAAASGQVGSETFLVISKAAELPGGGPLIGTSWERLAREIENPEIPGNLPYLLQMMVRLLPHMLRAADDATWESYWKRFQAAPMPATGREIFPNGPTFAFVDPARLRQVLPALLAEKKKDWTLTAARNWAFAAMASGALEILAQVWNSLPAELGKSAEMMDLLSLAQGDSAAIAPVLLAGPAADGATLLAWNLVTLPPADKETGMRTIPSIQFSALDGKFDIRLAAGPQPDRLTVVKTVPGAPSAGSALVELAPDQRFVAMVALDPSTGKIRWTEPREVPAEPGVPCGFTSLAQLPGGGPGGMPAWRIGTSGENTVCSSPWQGTAVSLDAWLAISGSVTLQCLNAAGEEVEKFSRSLPPGDAPLWQHVTLGITEKLSIPAGTSRLVVTAQAPGDLESSDSAISGLHLRIAPPPELPLGFQRLGRPPGESVSLAISPDASQTAFGLKSGKWAIANLADGRVTVPALAGESAPIAAILWQANGLYAATAEGELLRIDPRTGAGENVLELWDAGDRPDAPAVAMSPDGAWVAWQDGPRRLRLARLDKQVRRTFSHPTDFRFEISAAGIRFIGEDAALLPAADFVFGKPVPTAPFVPDFIFKGETAPEGFTGRAVPVNRSAAAIGADGAVYYVDELGNVVRAGR